jgi:hypothetical protein
VELHSRCIKLCGVAEGSVSIHPIDSIPPEPQVRRLLFFPGADQGLFRNPTHLVKQACESPEENAQLAGLLAWNLSDFSRPDCGSEPWFTRSNRDHDQDGLAPEIPHLGTYQDFAALHRLPARLARGERIVGG